MSYTNLCINSSAEKPRSLVIDTSFAEELNLRENAYAKLFNHQAARKIPLLIRAGA